MMLRMLLVALGFILLASAPSRADEAFSDCAKIPKAADRLSCFDRVSRDAGIDTSGVTLEAAPTVTTKEIVAPISPADYKNVDPADLRVAPNKFMGKPIELRKVHCFYADASEYRCIATSGISIVTVFGKDITPAPEKASLEADCGTIKMVDTPRCLRTIRLVPAANDQEQINAFASRVVVVTPTIEIMPQAGKKR